MENKDIWLTQMAKISGDTEFQKDVSQLKSKALLKEITTTLPDVNWNFVESQILRSATAQSFIIENLILSNPDNLNSLSQFPLRLASLWENLARLGEKTNENKALLNAAIVYEIAGFQANAACLTKKISKQLPVNETNSIESLFSLFLQRLFLKLKKTCEPFLNEQAEIDDQYQAVTSFGFSLAAQGFVNSLNYFLSGNKEFLQKGISCFQDSESVLVEGGLAVEANLVRSIRSLLPIMVNKSTWVILGNLILGNRLWERYLKLLTRGVGKDIFNSPSISELWPSQINSIENGLFELDSHKIIKMPTSAGKTRIAELAMVYTLTSIPGSKCVYVAPYKALVSELEQTFLDLFSDLGFQVSSIVGTFEKDIFEEQIIANTDILVTTPEKLDLVLRAQPEFLKNVHLFILDESHIISNGKRGIKFELLLTRLKRQLSQARFLLLSAVFSNDTLQEFSNWFGADKTKLIESKWRPSLQRYARFSWTSKKEGIIKYASSEDNALLESFIPKVIIQREYSINNPKTGRRNKKVFPDMGNKSQTAAELAFSFSDSGPVLVFCAQGNWVESVAAALMSKLFYAHSTDEKIPSHFHSVATKRSVMISSEWLGDDHIITKALKNGIAIHHGGLPDTLRKAIETDFREKKFQVLIATNTLAQGVNLPIKTVIIHSCRRYTNNQFERISISDYWNVAGRAGRAGYETEGTVIHLVNNKRDSDDYLYYLAHKDKLEPTNGALFKLLKDLVDERISDEYAQELLDSDILAILAEEGGLENTSIEDIVSESLVAEQAKNIGLSTTQLGKIFSKTAESIASNIEKEEHWKVFSATGLASSSCNTLRKYILENNEDIHNLLTKTEASIFDLLPLMLDALASIPEMEKKVDYDGDTLELLKHWLMGKNISSITSAIGETDTLKIANFVENYFGYLLPWGISSFLQIAMYELEIPEYDLPSIVSSLPSMIKFGVPTPEASWAMMTGIPIRQIAIEMSLSYSHLEEKTDYNSFITWLSKINLESLQTDYRLTSPILEDVSTALVRTAKNPLLKSDISISKVLEKPTWIAGISHENRWISASKVKVGQIIKIKRDYDNLYDRNAVKVYTEDNSELGFVERQLSQFLGPHLDCGLKLKGNIIRIEEGKIPQLEIQLTE